MAPDHNQCMVLFDAFNQQFFNEKLCNINIVWDAKATHCQTIFNPTTLNDQKENIIATIQLSVIQLESKALHYICEALLHEMIHIKFYNENISPNDDHGVCFAQFECFVNEKAAAKIMVHRSLSIELCYRMMNVWRCNGICQNVGPHFGWYRKLYNNPPGLHLKWWQSHVKKCGGCFVKQTNNDVSEYIIANGLIFPEDLAYQLNGILRNGTSNHIKQIPFVFKKLRNHLNCASVSFDHGSDGSDCQIIKQRLPSEILFDSRSKANRDTLSQAHLPDKYFQSVPQAIARQHIDHNIARNQFNSKNPSKESHIALNRSSAINSFIKNGRVASTRRKKNNMITHCKKNANHSPDRKHRRRNELQYIGESPHRIRITMGRALSNTPERPNIKLFAMTAISNVNNWVSEIYQMHNR